MQPTFWTAIFLNKFTLLYIRLNIYNWKTKFSFHKQYLFDLVFSRNAKKAHTDQSILKTFLLCLKRNILQTFRSSICKKVFFKCIYHWHNLLRRMFFIPCDDWKALFFMQIYCYQEVSYNLHVAAFFCTSVLNEGRILYVISTYIILCYLHYITILLIPKFQNKAPTS